MKIIGGLSFVVAVVGLTMSLIVHAATLAGLAVPGGFLALHLVAILVWMPTSWTRRDRRRQTLGALIAYAPTWMKVMVYGLFIYTAVIMMLNFLFFRGSVFTETFSDLFSAAGMTSFATAMAHYYPAFAGTDTAVAPPHSPDPEQSASEAQTWTCRMGHTSPVGANYCAVCGAPRQSWFE